MLAKMKELFLRKMMQRFAHKHGVQVMPNAVKNIAVWQFGGLGDMLLATPVIEALHDKYPHAHIHIWCSYPDFSMFLHHFPQVKSIQALPIYDFDMRTLCKSSTRTYLKSIIEQMKKQQVEVLVNLHVPKLLDWWAVEWLILNKVKPKYTLGFVPETMHVSLLDAYVSSEIVRRQHYTLSYQQLLANAGMLVGTQTHFPIQKSEQNKAVQLLKSVPQHKRVCLHMGGRRLSMENKMWSLRSFAGLAKKLINDGMIPIFIGVKSERDMGQKLCQYIPQALNLIGETSMGEMAALIKQSPLFIGHDSGPFHIAIAVRTPALAICGRPDAEPEYIAYHQEYVRVLIGDNPENITIDDVYLASKQLLS